MPALLVPTGGACELLADSAPSAEDPSWWLSGPPRLPNCRENPLWDDEAAQPAAPADSTSEVSLARRWGHAEVLRAGIERNRLQTAPCSCCLVPLASGSLLTAAGPVVNPDPDVDLAVRTLQGASAAAEQDAACLESLRSAVLALAADGEATSEQLWAIQEQVAGIAALCSGDFEARTALHFDGAQPEHTACPVVLISPRCA